MRLAQDEHYIISDSSSTILKDLPLIKYTYLAQVHMIQDA